MDIFGLAPRGVCHAARVALCAVRSYRTFSPLPEGGLFSVALSVRMAFTPYVPTFRLARFPVKSGSSSPSVNAQGGSLGCQIVKNHQIKKVAVFVFSFVFFLLYCVPPALWALRLKGYYLPVALFGERVASGR